MCNRRVLSLLFALVCLVAGECLVAQNAVPGYYIADTGNNRIVKVNDWTGAGWTALGTFGRDNLQFNGPSIIRLGPDGKIYVLDRYNARVVRMDDMTGAGWVSLGSIGKGEKQFDRPSSLAISSDGKIYIADWGNNRIVRVDDIAGNGWTTLGSTGNGEKQFTGPMGIAVGPNGKVYVADTGNHRIVSIDDMSGAGWMALGNDAGLSSPAAIYAPAAGNIYVVDQGRRNIIRFDDMTGAGMRPLGSDGHPLHFQSPSDIAIDPDGKILVVDALNNYIVRMDDFIGKGWIPYGTKGAELGQFTRPSSVCFVPSPKAVITTPVTATKPTSTPSTTPASPAAQNGVLATVAVGQAPLGVAVNSATHCAYVANYTDGTVSIIDANTNQLIKTVTVGANPIWVAVSPVTNRAYVTCAGATDMSVLDGITHTVAATIPVEQNAQCVAVNPISNLIYIVSEDEQKYLRVFDEKQNAMIDIGAGGGECDDVAVNPALNRIYVAISNQVSVIDAKPNIDGDTHTVIATIRLPNSPTAIAVDPVANRIYATVMGQEQLYVLDGAKNAILTTVKLAKGVQGVAVNSATGQVYVCNAMDKSLYVVDSITNTFTKAVPLGEKGEPTRVAVDPATNRVYVTLRESNALCVLDGNTWLTDAERAYMLQKISAPPLPKSEIPDPLQWTVVRSEPFAGSTIDTIKRNGEPWLHLRLDTTKSPNGMMKCHGLRTRDAVVDLAHPTEISMTLDWNNPASSNEMQAGFYLCPDAKSLAPALNTRHFIKVMYYGGYGMNVGAQARLEVSINDGGEENIIYDEGYRTYTRDAKGEIIDTDWGGPNFKYRTLGQQHLRLVVDNKGLTLWENDTQVCQCQFATLPNAKRVVYWPNCYLFLQQESSVKQPAREVYFSTVNIRQVPDGPAQL
ncbi:MAG: hypothetical protein ACYDBB_10845 [Armatimonadota bacterium]